MPVRHSERPIRSPLSKKLHSLLSSIKRIIQTRGHSCADPRPGRRLVAANSVGSLCTPTLIRPDNERREKAHVFQIEAEYGGGRRMALRHQRESIRYRCSIHDHCCMHGFISARAAISGCLSLRMKWIKLQSPSRELTLWGAYVGRFQYTLSYHSGAMKWVCSTKLSGSAEPSTPLGEFDHRHEAVAACEQHHRATEKHSARITSGRDGSCLTNWL
jgi:hypothetical protein